MPTEKKSSYKKLFSNTLIFALGSFSSKILIILLVNVYTTYLSPEEMGINDVIQQIANWLLPIVTMTISESVIRFGLDKTHDKKQVFSIANAACLMGFAGLAVILPIVTVSGVADKYLQGYSLLIFVYITAASLKLVYSNFLRALEKVKLYAINSILTTLFTLIGTVLFIVVFKMGNTGYLLSIIISDMLSTVFMLFAAKLWRYFDFRLDRRLFKKMFAYALPLIPAQLMWLVTNSSDSFMTTYYIGSERNGILSASYKIANLVSTVYFMFGQAWNMSAILEDDSDDRNEFYANVFHLNQCLLYILAAGCLMICRPLTAVWMGDMFQESARYAPILIYSTIFSCFTTFMGSIYLASNKTKRSLFTSMIAGVINIGANVFLIPRIGLYGPPISTVVSYLAVFIVRCFDSKKIIPFELRIKKIVVNNILLAAMTVISVIHYLGAPKYLSAVALPVLFLVILIINIKPVWNAALAVAPKKIVGIIERLGTKRLIAAAAAAVVYALLCYKFRVILPATLTVVFSAAAAFGIASDKKAVKLGGLFGIFVTLWAWFGLANACIALLVLSALDYLRRPDPITGFLECVFFIGAVGALKGMFFAVFGTLIIILIATISNFNSLSAFLSRLLFKQSGGKSDR
ncbi:MAG: polysaccharide biosynthesis C-terminal domain-containing protein [Oscillospiraceae bacterium]